MLHGSPDRSGQCPVPTSLPTQVFVGKWDAERWKRGTWKMRGSWHQPYVCTYRSLQRLQGSDDWMV